MDIHRRYDGKGISRRNGEKAANQEDSVDGQKDESIYHQHHGRTIKYVVQL